GGKSCVAQTKVGHASDLLESSNRATSNAQGIISTTAKFHWSAIGAVTPSVTTVPALSIPAAVVCTQNVSPTALSTHWCTIVWPAPSVRASALSQSFPTPNTSDPAFVVVSVAEAAPVDALCFADAPTPLALKNVTTVRDWS